MSKFPIRSIRKTNHLNSWENPELSNGMANRITNMLKMEPTRYLYVHIQTNKPYDISIDYDVLTHDAIFILELGLENIQGKTMQQFIEQSKMHLSAILWCHEKHMHKQERRYKMLLSEMFNQFQESLPINAQYEDCIKTFSKNHKTNHPQTNHPINTPLTPK